MKYFNDIDLYDSGSSNDWLWNFVPAIIAIAFVVVIYIFCEVHDYHVWNYGYCDCGGKWVYQQAVGHYYSTDYIYKCNECGRTHEFMEMR